MAGDQLGVVVLTHGSGGPHEALLEALTAERIEPDSIVVVHNPTEPGQAAPRVPAGCEVIQAERNLGYAAGMNLGVARLLERGSGFLLLLTHDARFEPGALDALTGAARRRPEYGVLGPALVLAGSGAPFSFGGVSGRNGTTWHLKDRPPAADGIADCDWVDGGSLLVRAEVFERVGSFDERFWGYCEESDLCLRARRAGWKVGAVLDAVAEQQPGADARPGVWSYLLTRNGAEYARRAVGLRGAAFVELRACWTVAFNLVRVGARVVRPRPGGPRVPWLFAVGTARGAVDFLRRRWGPPPRSLPGMGDVRNL
ncbi:MAG TPA: glycosyltransferase family 2 protein [Solirubrobacterales bacterium]|nr:glycosyltransferase family 2 protein [Solirubrobacterales bacterium]